MRYHYPQKQVINGGRAQESLLQQQGDQIISEGEASFYNKGRMYYLLSFLFIKEKGTAFTRKPFRVIIRNGFSKDLNHRMKYQRWAVPNAFNSYW